MNSLGWFVVVVVLGAFAYKVWRDKAKENPADRAGRIEGYIRNRIDEELRDKPLTARERADLAHTLTADLLRNVEEFK